MPAIRLRPIVCTAQPQKTKTVVRVRQIKESIQHARLLCKDYEDTIECKLAWEKVEELSAAFNDQNKVVYEERIYDL